MQQAAPQEITSAAASMLSPYFPGLNADKLEAALGFEPEPTTDRLRTRLEGTDVLHISMPTLDRMIKDGQLRSVKVRGRVLIPQSALDLIMAGGVAA